MSAGRNRSRATARNAASTAGLVIFWSARSFSTSVARSSAARSASGMPPDSSVSRPRSLAAPVEPAIASVTCIPLHRLHAIRTRVPLVANHLRSCVLSGAHWLGGCGGVVLQVCGVAGAGDGEHVRRPIKQVGDCRQSGCLSPVERLGGRGGEGACGQGRVGHERDAVLLAVGQYVVVAFVEVVA